MLRTYFTLAWRNLVKNKLFSIINIIGLSIGLCFVFIVGIFVWGELQVNAHVPQNVHILQSKWKKPGMGMDLTTLAPIGKALKDNYPNLVKDYYRHDGLSTIISKGDKHFTEAIQPGDSTLLTMFGLEMLYGNARTAFSNPNSVVITEEVAVKYFGRTNVTGETLTVNSFNNSKQDFEITGVLKSLPFNTVTNYAGASNQVFFAVASMKFFGRDAGLIAWNNPYMVNYIQLKEGVTPAALDKPIKQLLSSNTDTEIQQNLQIYPVKVADYYLQSNVGSARTMIYSLGAIGAFILLMAIINFVNITVGNAIPRLKEIGVRKVMGSSRWQLIFQFLVESVLMAYLAFIIAFISYLATKPFFGDILGKELPALSSLPVYFILVAALVVLLIGLLAGIYPAVVLSAQASITALKGKLKTVKQGMAFRYGLITFQFTTAIVVFISAIAINKQVSFFFDADLGYDKEQVITAKVPRDWTPEGVQHMETIRDEFARMPQVADASISFEIPNGQSGSAGLTLTRKTGDGAQHATATGLLTDHHYLSTYKIPLLAGQFFASQGQGADQSNVVINESAAKALGWSKPADAIGQQVELQGSDAPSTITGVVKDFHFASMQQAISPMLFIHIAASPFYRYISLKVRPGNIAGTVEALQSKWTSLFPDAPFEYSFMDTTLQTLYQRELQIKKAAEAATITALMIVLLGVLSIATLSIARRVKEVGIRKVLGASAMQVIWLFVKEFAWLTLFANLIAWPLAWLGLNRWLQNYAYRIHLNAMPFVTVTIALSLLVVLVISIKTLKTALSSPARAISTT